MISATLCKPIHNINYPIFICPFESGKCGKEAEKFKKIESREGKELFRWNKKHFL